MYIYEKWNTLLYKYMGLYILFHIYYTHYEGEYLRTEKKRYAYEHAYGGALCESRTINVLRIEEYYKINLPHPRTKRKKKAAYIRRTIIFFFYIIWLWKRILLNKWVGKPRSKLKLQTQYWGSCTWTWQCYGVIFNTTPQWIPNKSFYSCLWKNSR